MKIASLPDEMGFYGEFGGAFVPELLRPNVEELALAFNEKKNDEALMQSIFPCWKIT